MSKQIVTLDSIIVSKGLQTGPFGSQLKANEYTVTGIPVVMPKDISNGEIITDEIARVPEAKARKLAKHRIVLGDIIFPRRGDLGRIGVTKKENEGWLCGTGCLRARLKDEVDTNYIHQYVQLTSVKKWLERNALGQTMLNLNTEIISNLPIYLTSLPEQTAIADLLSIWDAAIEKNERLIEAKQKIMKGLMQQLLFGKRQFPDFVQSTERHETRWGSYPVDWDYPCIGEIAEQVSEKNRDGNELPVLSCTKHQGLMDSLAYFGKQVFSKDLSNYKIVKCGQFAYATNHIEEGSIGYQDLYEEALISPMYTVFETGDQINVHFLHLVLKTELYRHIFEANTSASVDRRGSLRWKEFAKIHVPLPSIEEQETIVRVFEAADKEISLLKNLLDAFKMQKRGLMQKLLTGLWRVKL